MQLWQTQRYQCPKIICCGTLEKPQFAYKAHTAYDSKGFVLDVEETAENVHDSVAWDKLYNSVTGKHEVQLVTIAAGYKTPWIAKKNLDDGKISILSYTRYKGKKDRYKPWEYTYNPGDDTYICPHGGILRHTTTDRDGTEALQRLSIQSQVRSERKRAESTYDAHLARVFGFSRANMKYEAWGRHI